MKNFALIGVAGFVAPRHLKAIRDTGNLLLAALDKSDSVGILDQYFSNADFFTEFERFDRHIDKLIRKGIKLDYLSICSPNYLHDAHIRFGIRNHADVICEKPLVLNPWTADTLQDIEVETGRKIYSILQLRHHPSIIDLKKKISCLATKRLWDIDLTYITTRGKWYYTSWKGDVSKSGGIATNIGIHFFDMLIWIFGNPVRNIVHIHTHDRAAGYLELQNARVRWFLSIDRECIPESVHNQGRHTYRSLKINGEEFDFSEGFTELHAISYQNILSGNGFSIQDARPAIELTYDIRNLQPTGIAGDYHPYAKYVLKKHPFSL